ncbi:MAG: hypothetical protein JXQ87_02305 [Bacteroidia bacterium]
MKQFLIATFAICLSVSAFAQNSKVTGFRDLVWGIHVDSVYSNGVKTKFKKDKESTEPNTFNIPSDNLSLGAATLTKITYKFNEDKRFKKVMMYGDNKYLKDIKDILAFKFGKATSVTDPTPKLKVSNWLDGDVSISLTQFKVEQNWVLSIESNWDLSEDYKKNMNIKDIVVEGEEVTGFRSFKWLQHKDSIYVNGEKLTFKLDEEANKPNNYVLDIDKYAFGSVRLNRINYSFNEDDKLTGIVLTGGKSSYDDMAFILSNKFGAPEDVVELGVDLKVMNWKKGSTTIKLTNPGSGDTYQVIVENSKAKTERIIKNRGVKDFGF